MAALALLPLTQFTTPSHAGLWKVQGTAHTFRVSDASGPCFDFDTTQKAEPWQVSFLVSQLERTFSGGHFCRVTDHWRDYKGQLVRFLRGVPVVQVVSSGDTHSVSLAARPEPLYKIVQEPFTRSPSATELEEAVLNNKAYRRVLYTAKARAHQQVAMSVKYWIPPEVHTDADQYFLVKKGEGVSIVDGRETPLRPLSAFWVERGQRHEIRTTAGKGPLQLFVAYAAAHHPAGRVDEINTDLIEWIEISN